MRYNPDTDQWEKTGDLDTPRQEHGASAVKWDDIAPFFCDATTNATFDITGNQGITMRYQCEL